MGYEQHFAVALRVKAKQLLQNQLSLSKTQVMSAQRGALRILQSLFLVVGATWAWSAPYYEGRIRVTFRDSARGKDIPITITYAADSASGDNRPLVGTGTKSIPTFGVVVIGHGYQMPVTAYKSLATTICRNPANFIAVLPETGSGLFPNHNDFALDMASAVAYMQREGKRKGSIWEGHIRDENIVAGHSMGGGAAFLAAKTLIQAATATLSGVIAFAPAETNPSSSAAAAFVTCPTLILAGGVDCVTPLVGTVQPIYDKLASSCKVLGVIPGASHCQFADVNTTCNLGELNCRATITRDAQFDRCWKYVNAFLERSDDFSQKIENTEVQTTMKPLSKEALKFERPTYCIGDTIRAEYTGDDRSLLWLSDSSLGRQFSTVARSERTAISLVRTTCFGTTRIDTIVSAVPRPTVQILGPRWFCPGDSIVLRASSNSSSSNPLRYRWSTGETTQQVSVRMAGNYSVEAISDRGCGVATAFASVDVLPTPTFTVTRSGDSIFCGGKGEVVVSLVGEMVNVQRILWSTGDTTRTVRLRSPGTYIISARIVVGDSLRCQVTSDTITLAIRRIDPTEPTITVDGETLIASQADTYQWLIDDVDIPGSTERQHLARRSGSYRVRTSRSDEGGCMAVSQPLKFVVSGVYEGLERPFSVRQMPGVLHLDVEPGIRQIEIRNIRGQIVLTQRHEVLGSQSITLDTSPLALDPHTLFIDGQPAVLFIPLR